MIVRRARWVAAPAVIVALALALVVALFSAYLLLSRSVGMNADGASNALQAWDMLHGNVLLRGWTVTDVSFYTNELLLFALVEAVYGLHGDTTHVVAALVFTLLVAVVAGAAKGRATGREAAVRVALAVAVVAVPALGHATVTQLTSPDHTGTAIPLLLTWLVLERAERRRWVPVAVAVMLAWAQIADPLVMYIGVLPLVLVSAYRLVFSPGARWREAGLIAAGFASVVLAQLSLFAIRVAGGFGAHVAEAELAERSTLDEHFWLTVRVLAVNFGAYFPDRDGPLGYAMGTLHLVGLLAALAATLVAAVRLLRLRGDRLCDLITVGIVVNVGAFMVSALPRDLYSARQVVAVLPLGAVLVGRVWGPPLAALRRHVVPALAVVLALLAAELAAHVAAPDQPAKAEAVAAWLEQRGLRYGLGEYWTANNVTVMTSGRVHVAPVFTTDRVSGYRWESKAEWYDATRHDARFLVVDAVGHRGSRTLRTAEAQFGPPVDRQAFADAIVLVYDHNLLVDLPAYCVPESAPSMADCPEHGMVLF